MLKGGILHCKTRHIGKPLTVRRLRLYVPSRRNTPQTEDWDVVFYCIKRFYFLHYMWFSAFNKASGSNGSDKTDKANMKIIRQR